MTTIGVAQQLDAENPWPGLEAFQENSRAFFRGRDLESDALLDSVLDAPVTVLYGRSGLGKTSLLRAGLFPMLRERHFFPIYVRFDLKPGCLPLAKQILNTMESAVHTESADAPQPAEGESLWEYLHRRDFQLWSAQNYPLIPVIVLDQFEEIFTLGERVPELVRAFETDLGDLAENRIPSGLATRIAADDTLAARFQIRSRNYKLLISLREDFLPDLETWCQLIPALVPSRMRLQRLQSTEAFDAVHGPAGHMMTEELARRIVGIVAGEDIHRSSDTPSTENPIPDKAGPTDDDHREEVEPALLSLFCRELNEERKRRGKDEFDAELVEEAKGDILFNYYASCVGDLPPQVAEFIETELITEKGFRNSYAREDAVAKFLSDEELGLLIGKRLLRLEERYGAQRIELTHDVLTGVVREQRDRRRAEIERQATAKREAEYKAEKERQQAQLEAARHRTRILQVAVAIAVITALVAAGVAIWGFNENRNADRELKNATASKLIYNSHRMLSGGLLGGDYQAFQQLIAAQRIARDSDSTVIWDALVGHRDLVKILAPQKGAVMSSGAGDRRILTADDDGVLRVWDTETGKPVGHEMATNDGELRQAKLSPDGERIITVGTDTTIQLWNVSDGERLAVSSGDEIASKLDSIKVDFSPDGTQIATLDSSGLLRVWDTAPGHTFRTIRTRQIGEEPGRIAIAFSPRGDRIATSLGLTVTQWDAKSGRKIGDDITCTQSDVLALTYSPSGDRIAAAGSSEGERKYDATLEVLDADRAKAIGERITLYDESAFSSVTFSPDGRLIAAGTRSGHVQVWDRAQQPVGERLRGQNSRVNFLAFSPDNGRILVGSSGTARVWQFPNPYHVNGPSMARGAEGFSAAFNADGSRVVTGDSLGTIQVWDTHSGQPVAPPMRTVDDPVYRLASSPDGRYIASVGLSDARIWDARSGKQIGQTLKGRRYIWAVAFSRDSKQLATGESDGTIRLWNVDTATPSGITMKHSDQADQTTEQIVYALAFSLDGTRLVSSGQDGKLRVWNPADGKPDGPAIDTRSYNPCPSVPFSPSGTSIASCDGRLVKLWDVSEGKQFGEPMVNAADVSTLVFSPDGRVLVSGDQEGYVQVRNSYLKDVQISDPASLHDGTVLGLTFDPEGKVLSVGDDNTLEILPPLQEFADQLCKKIGANISHKDWAEWVGPRVPFQEICPGLPTPDDAP